MNTLGGDHRESHLAVPDVETSGPTGAALADEHRPLQLRAGHLDGAVPVGEEIVVLDGVPHRCVERYECFTPVWNAELKRFDHVFTHIGSRWEAIPQPDQPFGDA